MEAMDALHIAAVMIIVMALMRIVASRLPEGPLQNALFFIH